MNPPHRGPAPSLAELAAEVETIRAVAESGIDLATRLDTVEHDLAHLLARIETLTALTALGQPILPTAATAAGNTYATLADWVDDVYARLAARHQARWCPRWSGHLDAVHRLELLWRTWETAHRQPDNPAARDEWTRVIFDHHTTWLLDREGPFAGCTPERCAPAPRLPQRRLDPCGGLATVSSLPTVRVAAEAAVRRVR